MIAFNQRTVLYPPFSSLRVWSLSTVLYVRSNKKSRAITYPRCGFCLSAHTLHAIGGYRSSPTFGLSWCRPPRRRNRSVRRLGTYTRTSAQRTDATLGRRRRGGVRRRRRRTIPWHLLQEPPTPGARGGLPLPLIPLALERRAIPLIRFPKNSVYAG